MGFYDDLNMNVKTMAERCREYYKPEDFVVIMNIDTEPFSYIIQRPENVVIHQPSNVTKELYYAKDPDKITLQVGQTRLVPAYEADHFIKQLVDKMVLENRGKIIAEGNTPTESAMDPSVQHKYIKQIYQGKRDFMDEYNKQLKQQDTQRQLVARDLEDDPVDKTTSSGAKQPKASVAPAA